MTISGADLRRTAGYFATGVTILTTLHEGQPHGLTVSSFASVSLDPPTILACLAQHARTKAMVDATRRFAVNLLAEDQEDVSRLFASKDEDKFGRIRTRPSPAGQPLLEGILAWLDCQVVARHPGGNTHTIYVAVVTSFGIGDGQPLLFYRGGYTRVGGGATPR